MTPNAAKKRKQATRDIESEPEADGAESSADPPTGRWAGKRLARQDVEPAENETAATPIASRSADCSDDPGTSSAEAEAGDALANHTDPWDLADDDETALEELTAKGPSSDDPIAGAIARLESIECERSATEAQAERERREHFEQYVDIVLRIDSTLAGDHERLAELVVQLGFDRARLERDVTVVRRVRKLDTHLARRPELEADRQAARADCRRLQAELEAAETRWRHSLSREKMLTETESELLKLLRENDRLLHGFRRVSAVRAKPLPDPKSKLERTPDGEILTRPTAFPRCSA